MELAAPTSLNNVVILVTEQQSCLLGFSTNTARMWLLLLETLQAKKNIQVYTQSTRLLGTVKLLSFFCTLQPVRQLHPSHPHLTLFLFHGCSHFSFDYFSNWGNSGQWLCSIWLCWHAVWYIVWGNTGNWSASSTWGDRYDTESLSADNQT